jgi:hypothetical protein
MSKAAGGSGREALNEAGKREICAALNTYNSEH